MEGTIKNLLFSTERKGIKKLIICMEDNGFFTSPCSSQFHLCVNGGLAEHSLNVYNFMMQQYENLPISSEITYGNIILSSLLHDLGKMGQYGKPLYTENYLANGTLSEKKPYVTNKLLLAVPHEIRSIQIASQFIKLTEEESFAILHHNGMYGDLKYQLQGKETPLQMLLHFSDMWASRVIEIEGDK